MLTDQEDFPAVTVHPSTSLPSPATSREEQWVEALRRERVRYLERRIEEASFGSLSAGLGPVRRVLVVLAAPRSGSSLLHALLARIPGLLTTHGESTPFYRISRVTPLYEEFDGEHTGRATPRSRMEWLRAELLNDLGVATPDDSWAHSAALRRQVALGYAMRLQLQWAEENLALEELVGRIEMAIGTWVSAGRSVAGRALALRLLGVLPKSQKNRAAHYDLETQERALVDRAPPVGAPPARHYLVEEPPFVLPATRRPPSCQELACKWMVVKASTDTARADWIDELCGDAQVRFVYLTRNPAASINGLMDGWNSQGFFSGRVDHLPTPARLRIDGYEGSADWTNTWWKFDRPPGWRKVTSAPLGEVCAFQWSATNAAAFAYRSLHRDRVYVMRSEELTRSRSSAAQCLSGLLQWLGLESDVEDVLPESLPVVQATVAPRSGRWKQRGEEIRALCKGDRVRRVAEAMGYDMARLESWP